MAHPLESSSFAVWARGLRQGYPVGFWRRQREVLHGIDLELARGEFLGLVGPNGSGKSTLLRALAGIEPIGGGELRVLGGAADAGAVKARTGFCPEDSPFPPEATGLQALELIASLYVSDPRRRAVQWLERVGLGHAASTRLGGWSRGMLRRFGLAQALLHEPDLILLDEPTAGLDALGLEIVEELLQAARARGATLVVSSHLLSDIHAHCSRVIVLVDGSVAASGSPASLADELGERAVIELALAGLDADGQRAVRAEVERLGGRVLGAQPSQRNLLELYRRARARRSP